MVSIATDRISAFDVILPRAIPYKGQVLNQLAAYFLEKTADIIPNWLINVPDPCVSIGSKLNPYKIEMVVRGGLVGYSWRVYNSGERVICGITMPDNMQEYDMFPAPIITPSTKAAAGHDEDISAEGIVERGLATTEEFAEISDYALKLFARGQAMANERGLVLMDTKYEFGKDENGKAYLIDEIHTPDSSRYFYKDSYESYVKVHSGETPKHLSKEFVREWLMAGGFSGHAGETVPEMTDDFVNSISDRYIELFEQVSGQTFVKPDEDVDPIKRIEASVLSALKELNNATN
jgi:phosphoribosylaminoimidazole-succinocarboxamide synthase